MEAHVVDLQERYGVDALSYTCPVCGPGWDRGETWHRNDAGRRGAPAGLYAHLSTDHGLAAATCAHEEVLSQLGPARDLDDGSLTEADKSLVVEVRRYQEMNRNAENPIQKIASANLVAFSGICAVEQFSAGAPVEWRQPITFEAAIAAQALENSIVAAWVLEKIDAGHWTLDGPGVSPGTLREAMRSLVNQLPGIRPDNADDRRHAARVALVKAGVPGAEMPAEPTTSAPAAAVGGGCLISLASVSHLAIKLGVERLAGRDRRRSQPR